MADPLDRARLRRQVRAEFLTRRGVELRQRRRSTLEEGESGGDQLEHRGSAGVTNGAVSSSSSMSASSRSERRSVENAPCLNAAVFAGRKPTQGGHGVVVKVVSGSRRLCSDDYGTPVDDGVASLARASFRLSLRVRMRVQVRLCVTALCVVRCSSLQAAM